MTLDNSLDALARAVAEVLWRDYDQEHDGTTVETFMPLARTILAAATVPALLDTEAAARNLDAIQRRSESDDANDATFDLLYAAWDSLRAALDRRGDGGKLADPRRARRVPR